MSNHIDNLYALIMAGGQGSRFWPVSRRALPKQFLPLGDDNRVLIRSAYDRVRALTHKVGVVCSQNQLGLIKKHVGEVEIFCEPVSKSTAFALGFVAKQLLLRGMDPVLLCIPSDHVIENDPQFLEIVRNAEKLASTKDVLVTIGITPTFANPGFGYIQLGDNIGAGAFAVKRFHEKPSPELARDFIESGSFLWNAGIFLWRASVLCNAIARYYPQLAKVLDGIKGDANCSDVELAALSKLDSVSIDLAVLEKADNCVVFPASSLGWSDVGSWDSWAEKKPKDGSGNTYSGRVVSIASKNNIVVSKEKLVTLLGVDDLVVVDTNDALLICKRERVQEVRDLVKELERKGEGDVL